MTAAESTFFLRLNKLGTPEKCALKRAVGKTIQEANPHALAAFYKCMPFDVPRWQEERWFTIACLRCLWNETANSVAPLEKVVSRMISSGDLYESTGHKIEQILDTTWDSDGYLLTKITRLVKTIRAKESAMPIDFSTLLQDLIYWNAQSQSTQRRWAREIFGYTHFNGENEEKEN